MFSNLLLWLDSSPLHYWLVAWSAFGCFVALALVAFVCARERGWWQSRGLVSLVMLLVLLAFRWPALFDNRASPDADESQFIAGALNLRHDPVFWRSVDGTTRGPLVDWPLLGALFLRGRIDYTTARSVSLLLVWMELISAWLILRHLYKASVAGLLVLPLLAAHCFADVWGFVAYCSEHVPEGLVAIGCWLLVTAWFSEGRPPNLVRLFAAGVVLGAMPYAKLQAVPIAIMAAAGGICFIFTDSAKTWVARRRGLLALVCGSVVPSLIILGMVLVGGVWSEFFNGYVLENFRYALGNNFPPDRTFTLIQAPEMLIELAGKAGNFGRFFFWVAGFGTCGLLFLRLFTPWHRRYALFAGALLMAAAFAVVLRGRSYVHYLQLLFFPAGLFGGVVAGALLQGVSGKRFRSALSFRLLRPALLAIFLCCGLLPQIWWRAQEPQPFLGRFTATRGALARWPVSSEILRHASAGERLGMWGWMPAFWVETGLLPATRDGETSRQIEAHPRREYYRARYLAELRRTHPPVFIDAVGPWNFVYTDRAAYAHEIFPELRDYIDENYRLVRDVRSTRVYVRNDRL